MHDSQKLGAFARRWGGVQSVLALFGSLLAPDRCAACDARMRARAVFCAACAATVVERGGASRRAWAPFAFGGAVAHAIHHFKYAGRAELARPLGELIRRGIPAAMPAKPQLVVPVPLHNARLAERGFNQAALLARPVARALDVPMLARALRRVHDTPRQAMLDRGRRLANVKGAFRVTDARLAGKHVLLVDDVRTTGATLDACERELRRGGALEVSTLVLAAVDT